MPAIIEANKIDIDNSKAMGLSDAMIDRLLLDQARIEVLPPRSGILLVSKILWALVSPEVMSSGISVQNENPSWGHCHGV